ncbi:hypothetical protein V8E53_014368, partial [Lactarius tabidus]
MSAVAIFCATSNPHNAAFSNTATYPVSPLSSHPAPTLPGRLSTRWYRARLSFPGQLTAPRRAGPQEVTLFVLRQRQTSEHDPHFSLPPQRTPHALPLLPRLLAPHSRIQSPR